LVPSLHFEQPNPKIDFAGSPFYVNASLRPWTTPEGVPRRAGVSSFGMGGTNAHVVVEEAPEPTPSGESREWQIVTVSAKSESALEQASRNLAQRLAQDEVNLADVAYTRHVGRTAYKHRRAIVCRTREDAVQALHANGTKTWNGVVETQGKV